MYFKELITIFSHFLGHDWNFHHSFPHWSQASIMSHINLLSETFTKIVIIHILAYFVTFPKHEDQKTLFWNRPVTAFHKEAVQKAVKTTVGERYTLTMRLLGQSQSSPSVCKPSSLGHVSGQLHEALPVGGSQQVQDAPVAIHGHLLLAQLLVQAGSLPQEAHVGGVVLQSYRKKQQHRRSLGKGNSGFHTHFLDSCQWARTRFLPAAHLILQIHESFIKVQTEVSAS